MFDAETQDREQPDMSDPIALAKALGVPLSEAEVAELTGSQDAVFAEGSQASEAAKDDPKAQAAEPAKEPEQPDRTVPLAALAAERERARREREAREQAEQQIAELTGKLAELQQARQDGTATQAQQDELAEQLNALREDFPAVAKLFESMHAEVTSLKAGREASEAEARKREAEQAELAREAAMSEAQRLIDANPKLLYWQTQRPELFEAAIEADERIAALPQFASLSPEDRFQKAVQAVEAIFGESEVPAEYLPKPHQTKKDVKAQAEKAVQAAGEYSPRSLSDLPGGMPPPSSETESMERIPAHQLADMFSKMTREQQDDYLAKFA